MPDLFAIAEFAGERRDETITLGAVLLRGFALPFADDILAALGDITLLAPFRRMTTRWGAAMSVATTNCGEAGWLSDPAATITIELTQKPAGPWSAMPLYFSALVTTNSSVKMVLSQVREPRHTDGACLILLGLLSGPAADAAHW